MSLNNMRCKIDFVICVALYTKSETKNKMVKKRRYKIAELFMSKLEIQPIWWVVEGSTAKGNFRINSDIDIFCIFSSSSDIPYPTEKTNFSFYLGGYEIDLNSFSKDWYIFKLKPELLQTICFRIIQNHRPIHFPEIHNND